MKIKQFTALRFSPEIVGNISDCISPPYDVIDDETGKQLYGKNQYNIVRIIKDQSTPADTPEVNQYTRAAQFLATWLQKGVLKPDSKGAIYAYIQDFDMESQHFSRSAFIALGKLRQFGHGVEPHEKTLDAPKADRLKLMRATAAQFGQIFMLYDDPEKIADKIIEKNMKAQPLIDFNDENNVRHRLLAIDDPGDIKTIAAMMADKGTVIADGHHRYETALNYYHETKNPAAEYRMMAFVNMQNKGLIILPTHRLITGVADFDIQELISAIKADFDITQYTFTDDGQKTQARQKMFKHLKEDFKKGKSTVGIYAASKVFYVAAFANFSSMDSITPKMSLAAKKLDVNIIHKLIFEKVLGIGDKQLAEQSNIEYIKAIGNAVPCSIAGVDSAQSQAVFFMNPTRIEQVMGVAEAGEKMPQKSTFFYPKIYTGLVINKL